MNNSLPARNYREDQPEAEQHGTPAAQEHGQYPPLPQQAEQHAHHDAEKQQRQKQGPGIEHQQPRGIKTIQQESERKRQPVEAEAGYRPQAGV